MAQELVIQGHVVKLATGDKTVNAYNTSVAVVVTFNQVALFQASQRQYGVLRMSIRPECNIVWFQWRQWCASCPRVPVMPRIL